MPVTIGLVAAGTQALVGGIQAATSGARKRERELEAFSKTSPVYQGSKPIDSYYSEAMRRYQSSPYQTSKFVMGKNLADRSQTTGLAALNQRGMALAGVSKLSENDNIDNSFFEFTDLDLRIIEQKTSDIKRGVIEFQDCDTVKETLNVG